jgi:rhodanese-related sulfurtransferase
MAGATDSRVAPRPLPRHRPRLDGLDLGCAVAVICASGQRSAVDASLVQRFGAQAVIHVVDGGVGTWARAGFGIEE